MATETDMHVICVVEGQVLHGAGQRRGRLFLSGVGVGVLEDVAFMQSLERERICQVSPGRQKCESRGTATSGVPQELQVHPMVIRAEFHEVWTLTYN